jgi:predicted amidohydrolase YtcJ
MHILFNAKIHTLDKVNPTGSALVINHGRILAVGEDDEILAAFDRDAEVVNLKGRTIIPGLTDAHIHLQHYALGLQKINLEVPDKVECLRRVANRVHSTPTGCWILGHGWNQNDWVDGFGNATDLDEVAPNHPVYLTSKSLHTSWVNSAALKKAGINANTADPEGGVIHRDEHGNPTGILLEGATHLVADVIPEPSISDVQNAILAAQTRLLEVGICAVHDFDQQVCFTALQQLHEKGELKLRVLKSLPLEALPLAVELGLRSGFGDDVLRIGGIKIFADGALGPHTAAMIEPYENEPGNRGMLFLDGEELYEHGVLAVDHGLSLAIHAIGDRANHEVLNVFQKLKKRDSRLRHRIEHVQILHPDDCHRLGELGIIASMQPIHATSDMKMAEVCWGNRTKYSYAWRTQLKNGAILAFGSDAPVESPNPFWGIHAAITRKRGDGTPGGDGWIPAERISVLEALKGFTSGAAYAAGMENRLGKLSPGYYADLVVLDKNPFECQPDDVRDIHPTATMIGGNWEAGAISSIS